MDTEKYSVCFNPDVLATLMKQQGYSGTQDFLEAVQADYESTPERHGREGDSFFERTDGIDFENRDSLVHELSEMNFSIYALVSFNSEDVPQIEKNIENKTGAIEFPEGTRIAFCDGYLAFNGGVDDTVGITLKEPLIVPTALVYNIRETYEEDRPPVAVISDQLGKAEEILQEADRWHSYGDVNFLDEGGVQIRATDREDIYEAIIVVPNPENEDTVFAGYTTIDISDYKADDFAVENAMESFGTDYTDEQLAAAVAENMGLVELGAIAFNENGSLASYAMSYDAYATDKLTVAESLMRDFGVQDSYLSDRLCELKQEQEQGEHSLDD